MAELIPEPLMRAERLAAALVLALGQCAAPSTSPYVSDELGLDYVTLDGKFDLAKLAELILAAARRSTLVDQVKSLEFALDNLTRVVRSAGVSNLMQGVQMGAVSWAIKCEDALKDADTALSIGDRRRAK